MRRFILLGTAIWAGGALAVLAAAEFGIRYNESPSIPLGFYRIADVVPVKGDFVAVCPPMAPVFVEAMRRRYLSPGRCPAGHSELLKVLEGQGGDHVAITPDGVAINGQLRPSTVPVPVDAALRPMPWLVGFSRKLHSDEVVVLSQDYSDGFDSRYFGALPRSAVVGVAKPLWTWLEVEPVLAADVDATRRHVSSFRHSPASHLGPFER